MSISVRELHLQLINSQLLEVLCCNLDFRVIFLSIDVGQSIEVLVLAGIIVLSEGGKRWMQFEEKETSSNEINLQNLR